MDGEKVQWTHGEEIYSMGIRWCQRGLDVLFGFDGNELDEWSFLTLLRICV